MKTTPLTIALVAALCTSVRADLARTPIQLDAGQRQAIGLTFGTAERRPVEKTIRAAARLDYDERKLAQVTLKVGGWVEELYVDYTGQPVRRGDRLLALYSPELLTAQREYLLARETARRLAGSNVEEARASADAMLRASRDRLRLWDLGDQQVHAIERTGTAERTVVIHAPIGGVVIEKDVVRGQRVEPGTTLYRIADLSTIWVYGDVYEFELPYVHAGQEARLTIAALPEPFTARVAWVAPVLDPKTRTARVRFELANTANGDLRPEMYGTLELRVPLGDRLVVPRTAVLDSGERQTVFVDAGDGRLVPRDVALGARSDDWVEVRDGLAAGDRVVTSANFLVDSESKLRAAESMIGMMGALGMGQVQMEGAHPMEMQGGGAGGAEEKPVGDLRVAVFPAAGTATVGANAVRIRIRDAAGNPVTGASVGFTYTMDMPGMAIEQAHAREVGDGIYEAPATFAMAGPWGLVVEIARLGAPPVREKFTLRVGS
jgi:Cu(I)/Ag(I) efflux system membrane fusion protein